MDRGDLIFYGALAISIISSIIKAGKKKPGDTLDTGMPDFKGSKPGDLFKKVIQDMMEKDDEFIPSSPKPELSNKKVQAVPMKAVPMKVEPMKRTSLASIYERTKNATENNPRRQDFKTLSNLETVEKIDVFSDPVLQTLDLKQTDELKRAIIYSEILRPKF